MSTPARPALSGGQVFHRQPPEDEPDAWDLYDACSEYREGIDWLATGVSRARLFITEVQDDGTPGDVPILDDYTDDDPDVLQLPLQELFGTGESQGEMLHRWATHLEVAGSTYIAGYDDPRTKRRVWQSAAQKELRFDLSGGTAELKLPDGTDTWVRLDIGEKGTSSLFRMWRRHPADAWRSSSPLQSLRPLLELILAATAAQTAAANSRRRGSGAVGIPDSLQVMTAPAPGGGATPGGVGSRDFAGAIVEACLAPLENPGSAASTAPIVFTGPGDDIAKISFFDWVTQWAEKLPELIDQAIKRLAIGMAIPPEVLTGFQDVNHWNSYTIMDGAVQYSIAPRVELIAGALTTAFVRPMLAKLGISDPYRYAVGYDLSQITHKPDQSTNATTAWDKLIISDDTYRRAMGFDDADKPKPAERQKRLEELLARTNADIAAALLGIEINTESTDEATRDRPAGELDDEIQGETGRRPAAGDEPAGDGRPSTERPADVTEPAPPTTASTARSVCAAEAVAEAYAWRMASLEAASLRALARCGHNLINRYGRGARQDVEGVDVREVHTVLRAYPEWADDMLAGAHYELRSATAALDPGAVEIVDAYVRLLLEKQTPHDSRLLAEVADAVAAHEEITHA